MVSVDLSPPRSSLGSGPACLVVPVGAALFLLIAFPWDPKPHESRKQSRMEDAAGAGFLPQPSL